MCRRDPASHARRTARHPAVTIRRCVVHGTRAPVAKTATMPTVLFRARLTPSLRPGRVGVMGLFSKHAARGNRTYAATKLRQLASDAKKPR